MTSIVKSECWGTVNSEQHLGFEGLAVSLDWDAGQSCQGVNPSDPPQGYCGPEASPTIGTNINASLRTVLLSLY